MLPFLLEKKKPFSLQGQVMVYLYKCPFCVFGEMDSTKGCGSDVFISTAFLSVVSDQSFDRGNVNQTVSRTRLYGTQKVQSECRGRWSTAWNLWNMAHITRGQKQSCLKGERAVTSDISWTSLTSSAWRLQSLCHLFLGHNLRGLHAT